MADYWKSQPRKFCQYCKCWIADNKPSVEFHERGKNHKENVSLKIAEIKKKSQDKAKQDERMSKEFATMEEAAMKAYKEDLRRMQLEAGEPVTEDEPEVPPPAPHSPSPPAPAKQEKPHKKASKGKAAKPGKAGKAAKPNPWLEGKSDDGHVYYYHSETGESSWEKPEGFQEPKDSHLGQNEGSSGGAWLEAVSPEGYPYYFNSETGESSWERPAHLPPPEEPSAPGTEPTPEREEEQQPPLPGAPDPTPTGAPGEGDPPAGDPQISVEASHKRKAEPLNNEAEGDAESGGGGGGGEKEEEKKEEEATIATPPPKETREEREQREKEEEQEKKRREKEERRAKRPRKATPYGTWEQIQPEEDPYAKVDLQLPQVEEVEEEGPELSLAPEPKPKFRERTITSLGGDPGGPASFRKSKTHNGKARSLRPRGEDD